MNADIKALEKLAETLKEDAIHLHGLNPSAMRSVADIILAAIGAPLNWPVREAGVAYADEQYPGSNTHRAGFNHGVKWAVENYQPSVEPSKRFG